jgi:hypothetical protein
MCVGMSSLDPLPSPPLLGFNLAPGVIAVQKGKLPNVTDVLFALSFSWKPRRFSLFIYVTVDVTAGVLSGFEGREVFSR